jgi:hypothetical protein
MALDQNSLIIHSGDTIFTLPVGDTVEIPLFLDALYSMLVANYFPLHDSVTRCELQVDGYTQADSSFAGQSLAGDTVTLSFDYLTASPSGSPHRIDLKVYGETEGSEELLYTGDTTINVLSGEDVNYLVVLSYVGSDTTIGASTIIVTLGEAGTVTVNGTLAGNDDRYYLTMSGNGNGTVSGSDSVTGGVPYTITAIPDAGYYFYGWQVTSGTALVADPAADSTMVTLENGNATVEGTFKMITYQKTYGGSAMDVGYSVRQTTDGGYIIAGKTASFGAGGQDVYLIKTTLTGDTLWTKTYGETGIDYGSSVQQTTDGGYIITGNTFSAGVYDYVYLIKTTSTGNTVWINRYGGTYSNSGNSVQQTIDGGYIITGSLQSTSEGDVDVYLIKTTSTGDTLWTKTYGGTGADRGYSVNQTNDAGYIITGVTSSFGAGSGDVYLIKTTSTGDTLWTKTYGGAVAEYGYSVQQTTDAGYIITGATSSFGAGDNDIYLIKTTSTGDTLWTKMYGGADADYGYSVQQTTDGGYIIAGATSSFGAGNGDVYLIKTTLTGDTLWTKTYGGSNGDNGNSVQQTTDGGYIITGTTASFGAGSVDCYLIKTDENGIVETMQ